MQAGLMACEREVDPPRCPLFPFLHIIESEVAHRNGTALQAEKKCFEHELHETPDCGTVVSLLRLLQQEHDLCTTP